MSENIEQRARELAQLMPMWGFTHAEAIRCAAKLHTVLRSMDGKIYSQLAGGARVTPKEDQNAPANDD